MADEQPWGQWVSALRIGVGVTPTQRARNYVLYKRIRDGAPEEERHGMRGGPLHEFVYVVPLSGCTVDALGTELTFRLDRRSETYDRLCRSITDCFPNSDPVDAIAAQLRDALLEVLASSATKLPPEVFAKAEAALRAAGG